MKIQRGVAATALGLITIWILPAQSESAVKIGRLDCDLVGIQSGILKKSLSMDCSFHRNRSSQTQYYRATIVRTGVALGNIRVKQLSWIVATLGKRANVKLTGTYVGAQLGASVGAGVGANYLVGGFNKKISLQPYSLEGKQGLGIQLGVQSLRLREVSG